MQQEGNLEFVWFGVFFIVFVGFFYLFISSAKNILHLWYLPQRGSSQNNPRMREDTAGQAVLRSSEQRGVTLKHFGLRLQDGEMCLKEMMQLCPKCAPGCPGGVTEGPAHPTARGVSHSARWVAPSLPRSPQLTPAAAAAAGHRILGEHGPWIAPTNALPRNPLGTHLRGGWFKL